MGKKVRQDVGRLFPLPAANDDDDVTFSLSLCLNCRELQKVCCRCFVVLPCFGWFHSTDRLASCSPFSPCRSRHHLLHLQSGPLFGRSVGRRLRPKTEKNFYILFFKALSWNFYFPYRRLSCSILSATSWTGINSNEKKVTCWERKKLEKIASFDEIFIC